MSNINVGDRVIVNNPSLATSKCKGNVFEHWLYNTSGVKLDDGRVYYYKHDNLKPLEKGSEGDGIVTRTNYHGEGFSIKENRAVTYTIEVDEEIYKFLQWAIGNIDGLDINEFMLHELQADDDEDGTKFLQFVKEINTRK